MRKTFTTLDDTEKLIKAIKHCLDADRNIDCRGCPYITATSCQVKMKREMLRVLEGGM